MDLLESYNELKAALKRIKDDEGEYLRLYIVDEKFVTENGVYPVLNVSMYFPFLLAQVEKDLKEVASETRQSIKNLMDDEERRAKEEEQNGTETD